MNPNQQMGDSNQGIQNYNVNQMHKMAMQMQPNQAQHL
jgi:hypothetical protein